MENANLGWVFISFILGCSSLGGGIGLIANAFNLKHHKNNPKLARPYFWYGVACLIVFIIILILNAL